MKFKKIGNNSIRVLITREDLWQYDIEMNDLMDNREKANEFLRQILARAYDEIGYVTNGQALSIQIAVLPDGNIDLMISDPSDLKLSQMISMLKERIMGLGMEQKGSEPVKKATEKAQTAQISEEDRAKAAKEYIRKRIDVPLWGKFNSLDQAICFSHGLSVHEQMPSILYFYKDSYYLRLSCSQMEDHIADIVLTLAEYASEVFTEEQGVFAIEEHAETVIAEDAVEKLSTLEKIC